MTSSRRLKADALTLPTLYQTAFIDVKPFLIPFAPLLGALPIAGRLRRAFSDKNSAGSHRFARDVKLQFRTQQPIISKLTDQQRGLSFIKSAISIFLKGLKFTNYLIV